MPEFPSQRQTRKQSSWTWAIPLGLLLVLGGLYFVWPAYQEFVDQAYDALSSGERKRVEQWVRGFGAWGFAAIYGLMLMQTLLAFLPSVLIMVVAVLAFGPLLGSLVAWSGLLIAATLGYAIGRGVGPVTVDRLIGSKAERQVEQFVARYGLWAVVAARISPVLSTDAVSIVAGLAKMRYVPFLLATGIGTLPLMLAIAWLGADIDRLETGLIWISLVSVAVFLAYVMYDRRHRRASEAPPPGRRQAFGKKG